jgi:hypothetical protein
VLARKSNHAFHGQVILVAGRAKRNDFPSSRRSKRVDQPVDQHSVTPFVGRVRRFVVFKTAIGTNNSIVCRRILCVISASNTAVAAGQFAVVATERFGH